MIDLSVYPVFLQDYGKLSDHFADEFDHLNSYQRGNRFAKFAEKLIPHTEIGESFSYPTQNQESHDKGVDLSCFREDTDETLYVQSKYSIRGVDDLDLIISKFESFLNELSGVNVGQLNLFSTDEVLHKSHFMIITSRDLSSSLLPKFLKSQRKTVQFYKRLENESRIHIIDGPRILLLLQNAFRKDHFLPSKLQLNFENSCLQMDEVYIGVVSGGEIKTLYENFGNSLFLENVREYLGPSSGRVYSGGSRTTVNEKIVETLQNEPEKFLSRNNGITFRASSVERLDSSTLQLDGASIINGCQTTLSIVQNPSPKSRVLIKIVQAEDSWDIAKASNFQNGINQLDLDLARYIRPQAIKKAATKSNVKFIASSAEASAYAILETIYENQISYEEVRSLFLGLFSRTPNNVLENNYTELLTDVIRKLFDEDPTGEHTFEIFFKIHKAIQSGSETIQENLSPALQRIFQRFWKDEKPYYRAFVAILALCGCVGRNIYANRGKTSFDEITGFLQEIQTILDSEPNKFIKNYGLAFRVVAQEVMTKDETENQMLKNMKTTIERSKFDALFYKLELWQM